MMLAQRPRGARLVRTHQARVTCHISRQDRSKAAGLGHSSGTPALRNPAKTVVSNKLRTFDNPP